jgi:hypothetical protein
MFFAAVVNIETIGYTVTKHFSYIKCVIIHYFINGEYTNYKQTYANEYTSKCCKQTKLVTFVRFTSGITIETIKKVKILII